MPDPASFSPTWAAFCAAARTDGPTAGAREQWHRGRAAFTVWVLRVGDSAVRDRVDAVRRALGDTVAPVPPGDLHVTLWVAGFPGRATAPPQPGWVEDAVDARTLRRQARALAALPAPRLVVGPATAFTTCAVLEVHDPHGDLARLRAALAAVSPPEPRFAPYLPHVTVGRFTAAWPAPPLARALAALRDLPPLPVRPAAAERVLLDAHLPDPPLSTVARVPLSLESP